MSAGIISKSYPMLSSIFLRPFDAEPKINFTPLEILCFRGSILFIYRSIKIYTHRTYYTFNYFCVTSYTFDLKYSSIFQKRSILTLFRNPPINNLLLPLNSFLNIKNIYKLTAIYKLTKLIIFYGAILKIITSPS